MTTTTTVKKKANKQEKLYIRRYGTDAMNRNIEYIPNYACFMAHVSHLDQRMWNVNNKCAFRPEWKKKVHTNRRKMTRQRNEVVNHCYLMKEILETKRFSVWKAHKLKYETLFATRNKDKNPSGEAWIENDENE